MNQIVVVDASVAFKVVIEEDFSRHARVLVATNLASGNSVIAPPHMAGEVINGIYQRLRRNNLLAEEAEQAIGDFLELPIQPTYLPELYRQAFLFARTNRLASIYDSLYVTLAQLVDAELWTDDRRLINSVEGVAPWVRWIGDYPLDE